MEPVKIMTFVPGKGLMELSKEEWEEIVTKTLGKKINNEQDVVKAHLYSNNHKNELENDRVCGCFYCLNIYKPSQIKEWIIEDNDCDKYGTAICPYCGIDAVIGNSSGYPITKRFLRKMNRYWF